MDTDIASTSLLPRQVRETAPGLLVALALGAISFATFWFLKGTWLKFSALLWSFIYAIAVTNVLPSISTGRFAPGIEWGSSRLLRLSIALLGLTISASVWLRLGGTGTLVVLLNMFLALLVGSLLCRLVLKIDGSLSVLLVVGTCICGATAIAAMGPAIKAKAEQMGLSLAAITLFGRLAMFTYPLLFDGPLGPWLGGSYEAFGMWVGMGVHETAQVIAAASQVDEALSIAMTAKSIRIFMIGPMVFAGLLLFRRFASGARAGNAVTFSIPWFAVAFVVFSLVRWGVERLTPGQGWIASGTVYLNQVVTFLLAWAFAAVGLKVKASSIRVLGFRAFLGGLTVAVAAGVSALLLTKYLWLPLQS